MSTILDRSKLVRNSKVISQIREWGEERLSELGDDRFLLSYQSYHRVSVSIIYYTSDNRQHKCIMNMYKFTNGDELVELIKKNFAINKIDFDDIIDMRFIEL